MHALGMVEFEDSLELMAASEGIKKKKTPILLKGRAFKMGFIL